MIDSKVATADGVVQGLRGKRGHRGTISWRGIPFAAPPVAGRRFQNPQPVTPWPGVRDCTRIGKAAIQDPRMAAIAPGKRAPISEDCLTLNVFAPEQESATPRPVMVFIHGGAYILGTAATPLYNGSALARAEDVIVVTIQYRFGPFGYLDFSGYSTDERRFDENPGLADQLAALRWVQRNISGFGGDPDNVTVFGESAGACSVVTLLSTPSARGLFARAIAESPVLELIVDKNEAGVFADEFLRQLADPSRRATTIDPDLDPIDPDEAARLLDGASAADLHRAGERMMAFAGQVATRAPLPFAPVVGGDLVPQSPMACSRAGQTLPVPLIIGNNREEGRLFEKFWNLLPEPDRILGFVDDMAAREAINNSYGRDASERARLSADAAFWAPIMVFADGHSRVADTRAYRFDFYTRVFGALGLRATHATELFAVFGAYRAPVGAGFAVGDWSAAARVSDDVQSRWGDFARGRAPGSDWPLYSTSSRDILVFDRHTHVEADPDSHRREAWSDAYELVMAAND